MVPTRFATSADIEELIRLRILMYASLDRSGDEQNEWQDNVRTLMHREFSSDSPSLSVAVVEGPNSQLAACAVGFLLQRLPGPRNATGLVGYIANVSTDPRYRRLGYSRACTAALLDWFRQSQALQADLRSSPGRTAVYPAWVHTHSRSKHVHATVDGLMTAWPLPLLEQHIASSKVTQ